MSSTEKRGVQRYSGHSALHNACSCLRLIPFDPAFLGLCCSRIWTYAFMMVLAIRLADAFPFSTWGLSTISLFYLMFFGVGSIAAFAHAVPAVRVMPSKSWIAAISACGLVAAALLILPLPGVSLLPATALGGISLALFRCTWGNFYTHLEPRQLSLCTPMSFLLAIALIVPLKLAPIAVVSISLIVLPPVTSLCLARARRYCLANPSNGDDALEHKGEPADKRRFWPLATGMFIFVAASSALSSMLDPTASTGWLENWRSVIADATIAVIFVALYAVCGSIDALLVYRFVLPLVALGYVLFPLVPGEHQAIGAMAAAVGYGLFDLLSWVVMIQYARERPGKETRIVGIGVGAAMLGRAMGTLCGALVLGMLGPSGIPFTNVSLVMLFVLLVVCLTILPDRFFGHTASKNPTPQIAVDTLAAGCSALAARSGLTVREGEVLLWLSRGRNAASIADELGISRGTVQTHIKHVYAKTDLHNQQELIKTIEQLGHTAQNESQSAAAS